MKKNTGFTLIELMIVVAIIAIIAAIAIPNLLRSRMQSNESASIGNLRTINGAEVAFHSANNQYAITFDELTTATPPFLDGDWAAAKSGYNFVLGGTVNNFSANADPVVAGTTGNRYFFVDASGVLRFSTTGTADVSSTPLGETP
jgi:prepilin-type N-terminal cleavage/methylation domain-containing protein